MELVFIFMCTIYFTVQSLIFTNQLHARVGRDNESEFRSFSNILAAHRVNVIYSKWKLLFIKCMLKSSMKNN